MNISERNAFFSALVQQFHPNMDSDDLKNINGEILLQLAKLKNRNEEVLNSSFSKTLNCFSNINTCAKVSLFAGCFSLAYLCTLAGFGYSCFGKENIETRIGVFVTSAIPLVIPFASELVVKIISFVFEQFSNRSKSLQEAIQQTEKFKEIVDTLQAVNAVVNKDNFSNALSKEDQEMLIKRAVTKCLELTNEEKKHNDKRVSEKKLNDFVCTVVSLAEKNSHETTTLLTKNVDKITRFIVDTKKFFTTVKENTLNALHINHSEIISVVTDTKENKVVITLNDNEPLIEQVHDEITSVSIKENEGVINFDTKDKNELIVLDNNNTIIKKEHEDETIIKEFFSRLEKKYKLPKNILKWVHIEGTAIFRTVNLKEKRDSLS